MKLNQADVEMHQRKEGIAQNLYENIFKHALNNNYNLVCAKIDIEPEYNHKSTRFHEKRGFHEVGTRISKQTLTVHCKSKNWINLPNHPYQNPDCNHSFHNMVHYLPVLNRNSDIFSYFILLV